MLRLVRFLMLALAILAVPYAAAKDMPVVDPADILAKYGKPDRTVSTEYDKPRPPFVTRMLEYKKGARRGARRGVKSPISPLASLLDLSVTHVSRPIATEAVWV